MKTDTKHTPGPWKAEGNGIFGQDGIYIGAAYSPVSFGAKPLCAEALTNAQLIAAAPDLLGALVGMVNRYGDKSAFPTCDASISARAAISKAEGGK